MTDKLTLVGTPDPDENPDENKTIIPLMITGSSTDLSKITITVGGQGGTSYVHTGTASGGSGEARSMWGVPVPPSEPTLFGTWIKDTVDLQEEFYKPGIRNLPQGELEDWIRINTLAAEDELHEALQEISWKPWAKSEYFNREAFIGEIVDVLHFVANMLGAANCTDEELNAAYLEKMERNRERQRQNYTGLDKCTKCNRAADDVRAHGGVMKSWIQGHPDSVHSTGYGCNRCFCDPGDDYK